MCCGTRYHTVQAHIPKTCPSGAKKSLQHWPRKAIKCELTKPPPAIPPTPLHNTMRGRKWQAHGYIQWNCILANTTSRPQCYPPDKRAKQTCLALQNQMIQQPFNASAPFTQPKIKTITHSISNQCFAKIKVKIKFLNIHVRPKLK